MSQVLTRVDRRLSSTFDDETTPVTRRRSRAARMGASVAVSVTGVLLLSPNIAPLFVGGQPPFSVALSVFGSLVCLGLAVSGYLLYRSGFSTANAVRIAVWNLLGVVVLGAVLWLHGMVQGPVVFGADGVESALTAGNILAISTAAHVVIGVHDARRVRAEQLADEQRKLAVLNRALRHNLRNESTILVGHGERLEQEVDDPSLERSARVVAERARTVGGLADKAKTIIELFERERRVEHPHDVRTMVDGAAAEVTGDAGATVDVSVPDGVWVWADDCYRTALGELVENALEHGEPPVEVTVTADDEWVHTCVRDAGAGVPAHESVVVGGEADITPLTHASGLGLWLARSAAEANGGHLRFEEESAGTVVTLSHRRATGPTA
jgi:signal transduction histidine kinase